MPIYTYECSRGHQTEAWQGIKEEPLTRCWCRASARRIIVPTAGHIVDPTGVYQPAPGFNQRSKRQNETKITKREFERQDQKLRAEMLEVHKRGPRLDLEPKKQGITWF